MTLNRSPHPTSLVAEINDILVDCVGLAPADAVADGGVTLEQSGLDSLASMELQAVLEARYGVVIPDDSVGLTVAALATFVSAQLQLAG